MCIKEHGDKVDIKIAKKYSCEKCCFNFLNKDKLNKHQSDMHKAKLTFLMFIFNPVIIMV